MNARSLKSEKGLILAGAALLLVPAVGAGQAADLEVMSRQTGVPLPQAYYDMLRRDPTAYSLPRPEAAWAADRIAAGVVVEGELPVLLIPALFADSEDPLFSRGQIQDALFDGDPSRTLSGFYGQVSGGRLELAGTVAPWVRTSYTEAEVTGSNNGLGTGNRLGDYLVEALTLADEVLDFGQFDNDGPDGVPNSGDDDGWVDALAFEFQGIAGSCGGSGIWPHLWGISPRTGAPYESQDRRPNGQPIRADAYIIGSVSDCSGQRIHGPGVMAHELGHTLGLPDIYHPLPGGIGPDNRRWVVGCWGLMAAGTWGCDQEAAGEFGPTHLSAWSKIRMGWAEVVDVETARNEEFVVLPTVGSNQVLRVPMDDRQDEFLLLEYRTREGFDRDLPAAGVLVYHEDRQASFRPFPDGPRHYRISVLEADGNENLLRIRSEGGNRGEAADAFARDGAVDALASFTDPGLLTHAGAVPRITIHSMAADGQRARIRISRATMAALLGSPPEATALEPYRAALTVAGGVPPYAVESTEGELPRGLDFELRNDSLVLEGVPRGAGEYRMDLLVTDALGASEGSPGEPARLGLSLRVRDISLAEDRLLELFLRRGEQPLSGAEVEYLDQAGNMNGRYDVGDLRAYLNRTGRLP